LGVEDVPSSELGISLIVFSQILIRMEGLKVGGRSVFVSFFESGFDEQKQV
jgi:hypothetical protein